MKFTRFTIVTTTEVEELLAYNINEMGLEGVEIVNQTGLTEQEQEQMFVDILPEVEDDGRSILQCYLPEGEDPDVVERQIAQELTRLKEFFDIGEATIVRANVDDADWKDRWKEHFKPFYIEDILICPSWITPPAHSGPLIRIDPGGAFGTGLHETTRLCMKALRYYVKGDDLVLDVGCGSGILSILAEKLGASEVVAVDIDPEAVRISEENFVNNNVKHYDLHQGNLIDDQNLAATIGYGRYDVIVANLLAEIVVKMSECFLPHLKRDGMLITSGILEEKVPMVMMALQEHGFHSFETMVDGEWVAIIAKR